jgi:hypothetical protein
MATTDASAALSFRRKRWFLLAAAWSLGATVTILAIISWGSDLGWHLLPFNAYVFFPVLGLAAYSLMWSQYAIGVAGELSDSSDLALRTYFQVTGWIVLVLICLHPGLLIYQRFHDGFGLPPHSYESYVAPGLGWLTLLGSASLLVFLAYEFHRIFGNRPWWRYVQVAVDAAMLAIFYHGLRLGNETGHGWFRVVWWFYGLTLILILIRTYSLKYRHRQNATKQKPGS